MLRNFRTRLIFLSLLLLPAPFPALAQTEDNATAPLREVRAEGEKLLSEAQVTALTGLAVGSQVGRADLQTAADKLVQSGLFAKVSYNFQTRSGVIVTYHVEESPRIPAYFDNIPWFADSELDDAIRKKIPFFDGTLPEAGGSLQIPPAKATSSNSASKKQHCGSKDWSSAILPFWLPKRCSSISPRSWASLTRE